MQVSLAPVITDCTPTTMPPRTRLPNCRGTFTAFKHIQPKTGRATPSIRAYMATAGDPKPVFSEGTADVDALRERLNTLLTPGGGRWALVNGGEALERTFKFKTFAKTWVSFFLKLLFIPFMR